MATAQSSFTGVGTKAKTEEKLQTTGDLDAAESMLKTLDKSTQGKTGISLFHILTFGSIGASIALFLSGKKEAGIFIGLWPPTFQALKSVVDKADKSSSN